MALSYALREYPIPNSAATAFQSVPEIAAEWLRTVRRMWTGSLLFSEVALEDTAFFFGGIMKWNKGFFESKLCGLILGGHNEGRVAIEIELEIEIERDDQKSEIRNQRGKV